MRYRVTQCAYETVDNQRRRNFRVWISRFRRDLSWRAFLCDPKQSQRAEQAAAMLQNFVDTNRVVRGLQNRRLQQRPMTHDESVGVRERISNDVRQRAEHNGEANQ